VQLFLKVFLQKTTHFTGLPAASVRAAVVCAGGTFTALTCLGDAYGEVREELFHRLFAVGAGLFGDL
jgi:hypothetical protein